MSELKLLIDENLSPTLVQKLAEIGIPAQHVAHVGLAGQPDSVVWAELNHMKHTTIAKTANRVVLGSMNDFENLVVGYRPHQHSLLDVSLQIAEAPCKPIRYQRPKDAALVALGSKPSPPVAKLPIPQPAKHKRPMMTDADYERMVEEATVDAYGDEEQATGWHCVIDEHLKMPFDTQVLGVSVRVEKIDILDDLSIVAVCRRGPHRQTVLLLDLPMPSPPPEGAEWIEAYRRWKE